MRRGLFAVGLVAIGAGLGWAQREGAPPRGDREPPGGVQMTASGKFVYLLRGEEIWQFEATSLEFVKKVRVPPPERRD